MCAQLRDVRLETKRLTLRRPRPEDADWIAERINDYDIARMTGRIPHPYSPDDAEAYLRMLEEADPCEERAFMVEDRVDGLAGVVGFHAAQTQWSESGCAIGPELGYWFARDAWGKGLATEAVQAALGWASGPWRRKVVAAGHFADNPASGRVLEKAGFLYTGEIQPRFSVARGRTAPTRMMVWMA